MSKELKIIRSGMPDVIVVDEQCVRGDIVPEAQKLKIPVIASNAKIMYGLPNRTDAGVEETIEELKSGAIPGAVILDYEKLGEISVRLAQEMHPIREAAGVREIPSDEQLKEWVDKCADCGACYLACPIELDIPEAMKFAKQGDFSYLEDLHDACIGCRRCEQVCKKEIPILSVIEKASQKQIAEEKGWMRAGRGQVSDAEIRAEGLTRHGYNPSIIAIIGCPNYSDCAKPFIQRGVLETTSLLVPVGSMDMGMQTKTARRFMRDSGRFPVRRTCQHRSCLERHITEPLRK